jgi:hypothetical protein
MLGWWYRYATELPHMGNTLQIPRTNCKGMQYYMNLISFRPNMRRVKPHFTTNKMLANHNSAILAMQFSPSFIRNLAKQLWVCTHTEFNHWMVVNQIQQQLHSMALSHVRILCSKFINLSTQFSKQMVLCEWYTPKTIFYLLDVSSKTMKYQHNPYMVE